MAYKQTNPFVGLRPFRKNESHLFFGREEQVDDILQKLISNRLVTIMGNSGAGKSSFVYCSLLPMLESGFEICDISNWNCFCMFPGTTNPVLNLAVSITNKTDDITHVYENLANDPQKIVSILKECTDENTNTLIFIDQFEELFRIVNTKQIAHFLEIILAAVNQTELPIYVLTTIRSDLIGYCSEYPSFTKKMNQGQYLLPRMTSEQKRQAIICPIKLMGADITDELVERLIEDEKSDNDQLPVMQHALMRTWNYWNRTQSGHKIGVWEYEAIGTISKALSVHANEIFAELPPQEQELVEKIFRIVTISEEGRSVRNPERISKIAQITKFHDYETIYRVINTFRFEGRSFFIPNMEIELSENTLIDISHESLIRIWDLLNIWIERERESIKQYVRLAEKAIAYQEGKVSRLSGPELQLTLAWRNEEKPSETWAIRHHPAYENAMLFLDFCEKKEIQENERKTLLQKNKIRVQRLLIVIFLLVGIMGISLAFFAAEKRELANIAKIKAEENAELARVEKINALQQQEIAERKTQEALDANKKAIQQQVRALGEAMRANKAKEEALKQTQIAQTNYQQAIISERRANTAKEEAFIQRKEATEQREKAERLFFLAESKSIAKRAVTELNQGNKDTATTLALHAFFINKENDGPQQIEDIYIALNQSLNANELSPNIPNVHTQGVASIAVDNRTGFLTTAGHDGYIKIWEQNPTDNTDISLKTEIKQNDRPTSIKYLSGDNTLAVALGNEILIYDTSSKIPTLKKTIKTQLKSTIKCFEYLETKNQSYYMACDGQSLSISKQTNNETSQTQQIATNAIVFTTIKAENSILIYLAEDSNILKLSYKTTETSDLDEISEININKKITALKLTSNGKRIAIGTSKGTIEIRDAKTLNKQFELNGHRGYITDLKFNPVNSAQLASVSLDKTVRLWLYGVPEKNESIRLETELWTNEADFTPDGNYIVTVGEDKTMRLWPTNSEIIAEMLCKHAVKISKDKMMIYTEKIYDYKEYNCVRFE